MTAPARTAAYHALRAIAAERADLPTALAESRRHLPDERDRALAAEIVSGTLRWQRYLEHIAEHFSARPVARIDRDVLHILRLSLYQLLHLDRVPASAVVDDAVDLARQARKTSATGFVNAVLRAVQRERHRLPVPPRPGPGASREAMIAYLGITCSHPEWLVTRWLDRHGFDATDQWVRFNNDTPQMTLRANTLRACREDVAAALIARQVETETTRHAPDGLVTISGNPLRRTEMDGTFFVQDEASQLVSLVVGARPGERVLDLCASPGGKTVSMAADMSDSGVIAACDVRPRRLALLRDTVRTSGASHVQIVQVAPSGGLPFASRFDRVLVDAPCSGLGTIRRDPDIRWRRREADLEGLARQELALLERAATLVRPGGRLVYATCSSEPEENEAVVDAFMSRHLEFAPVDLRTNGATPILPLLSERGMLQTWPFAHRLEAFFASAMERSGIKD
jgi:16S rRNA (cytosine967-C5)-methyltransferase